MLKAIDLKFLLAIFIAAFIYNLSSYKSKYDVNGLNGVELDGKALFFGKAKCGQCHSSSNFNGYNTAYENIGLDMVYTDNGRERVTHNTNDIGKFNVPTLRNIALTAPYMHDGRYQTLGEVIDHYNTGIQNNINLSLTLRDSTGTPVQLGLTDQEKSELEHFLRALTDADFVATPKFSDPF